MTKAFGFKTVIKIFPPLHDTQNIWMMFVLHSLANNALFKFPFKYVKYLGRR
jgi:hypothetical protein